MAEAVQQDDITVCFVCKDRLHSARILPCLHVFCDGCLSQHSRLSRSIACPMCNFEPSIQVKRECKFLENYMQITNQKPEVTSNDLKADPEVASLKLEDDEEEEDVDPRQLSDSDSDLPDRSESVLSRRDEPQLFCSDHPSHHAEEYCPSCKKIICEKCTDSLHRRCKDSLPLQEAVEMSMLSFNTIHQSLTKVFLETESKVVDQNAKCDSLAQQKQQAKERLSQLTKKLIDIVIDKEKAMVREIDAAFDEQINKLALSTTKGQALSSCVQKSVDVFECAMSMNGQGELLELEPGINERVAQYSLAAEQLNAEPQEKRIEFCQNEAAVQKLEKTLNLGEVTFLESRKANGVPPQLDSPFEGKLTLMSSFHGGSREDTAEPLLTDVLFLNGGDVILTDRDNKCLKKFNSYGKVLTRVPIPDVPSRIAVISNSKIAVTVMNKKILLFFSIFGTLRILAQVKTKKQYAYIAGTEDGNLLVGTSNCDTIDIISQTGQFIKTLFTQKSEKAVISRPLYLTQTKRGHFLVSDSGRRLMFSLDDDGNNRYTYKPKGNDALECPLGVASDVANFGLLADRDGNSIHLISPKGELVRKILTEEDSLTKPCGIHVAGKTTLAITQVDGYVKVYKAGEE